MGGGFTLWSLASMAAEGREPLRVWISLCFLLFLRPLFMAFHRFLNSWRSVTPIWLKFGHDFYPDIGFLAAKEGHQPPYGVATRAQCTPLTLVGPSGIVSHWFHFSKYPYIPKKISVSFYPVWTLFDMDFLWNKKHATNSNWHWALDQYVRPKNSIKSCQKYVKVVEYWHGIIKKL